MAGKTIVISGDGPTITEKFDRDNGELPKPDMVDLGLKIDMTKHYSEDPEIRKKRPLYFVDVR